MSWRFQRRKKLIPGVTLNVGKRGAGLSVGRQGARVSASRRGLTASLALLGTGPGLPVAQRAPLVATPPFE